MERSRCTLVPTIHEAAATVQTSFQKYVRESCGFRFSAVKYERARAPPCCALRVRYPLLFMSEYSKTVTLPSIPCHSVELHSAPSFNCLFKRPFVALDIRMRKTVSDSYVRSLCGSSQETTKRQNQSCILERKIIFQEMQGNTRNIILILFTHNYIIKILVFVYINILIENSLSFYLCYHIE